MGERSHFWAAGFCSPNGKLGLLILGDIAWLLGAKRRNGAEEEERFWPKSKRSIILCHLCFKVAKTNHCLSNGLAAIAEAPPSLSLESESERVAIFEPQISTTGSVRKLHSFLTSFGLPSKPTKRYLPLWRPHNGTHFSVSVSLSLLRPSCKRAQ